MRVYPGTAMAAMLDANGPLEGNPGIRRKYQGPIDLTKPTFFISEALGERPSELVCDLIAGDERFFEPISETPDVAGSADPYADYNYNCNAALEEAIASGARGAYWDILRRLRSC